MWVGCAIIHTFSGLSLLPDLLLFIQAEAEHAQAKNT
jgi:hypothetical protein